MPATVTDMRDRPHLRLVARREPEPPDPDAPVSREEAELIATLRALLPDEAAAAARRASLRLV